MRLFELWVKVRALSTAIGTYKDVKSRPQTVFILFCFSAKYANYRSLIRRLLGAASLIRLWIINRVSTRWKRSATIECLPFIYSSFRHSFYKDRLTVWTHFRYRFHFARWLWWFIFKTPSILNHMNQLWAVDQPQAFILRVSNGFRCKVSWRDDNHFACVVLYHDTVHFSKYLNANFLGLPVFTLY